MAKEAKEQRFLTSAGYARSFSEMLQRSDVVLRMLGNESLRRSRPPRSSVGTATRRDHDHSTNEPASVLHPVTLFHVTPTSRASLIKAHGIQPRCERRGIFADGQRAAVYAFADIDTAIDGLTNWLSDQDHFRLDTSATVLRFQWDGAVEDDPEIAGSYIIRSEIPASSIIEAIEIELGEPE